MGWEHQGGPVPGKDPWGRALGSGVPPASLPWELSAAERMRAAQAEDAARRERADLVRAARRHRRRVRAATCFVVVLALGLVVVGLGRLSLARGDEVAGRIYASHADDVFGRARSPRVGRYPDPPDDEAPRPLGHPIDVPSSPDHAFRITTDRGDPVAWSPCRPVHIVINDAAQPAGTDGLVEQALAEVQRVTGLQLEVEGTTDEELLGDARPLVQERYGDRWAPVLITWTDPSEVDALAGDVVGVGGGSSAARGRGPQVYVSGLVALDAPHVAALMAAGAGRDDIRGMIQHEVGHLVGLDHTSVETELMAPAMHEGVTTFGPGDLAGLAELGAGPCAPDL